MTKTLFAIALILFASVTLAKDKAVSNDYQIILQVNEEGKVVGVKSEKTMPTKIRDKTLQAFINREIGKRTLKGKAIAYEQELVISTKYLVGNTRVSKR